MIHDVEHLFLCLLAGRLCVIFGEMSLRVQCQFLNVNVFLVEFQCAVVSRYYQICDFQILFTIWWIVFFTLSFDTQSFLSFMESSVSIFSFVFCAFDVLSRTHCQVQCHKVFLLCCLLGDLLVQVLTFSSGPFDLIFGCVASMAPTSSHLCGCPDVPAPSVGKLVLSPLSRQDALVRNH